MSRPLRFTCENPTCLVVVFAEDPDEMDEYCPSCPACGEEGEDVRRFVLVSVDSVEPAHESVAAENERELVSFPQHRILYFFKLKFRDLPPRRILYCKSQIIFSC